MFNVVYPFLSCQLVVCCVMLSACLNNSAKRVNDNEQVAGYNIVKKYNQTDKKRIAGIWISSPTVIFEDSKGVFWLGNTVGLFRLNRMEDQWERIAKEQTVRFNSVKSICQDSQGTIWVLHGLDRRVQYFDGKGWHDAIELSAPAFLNNVRIMFRSLDGKLRFLFNNGIISFNGYDWTPPFKISKNVEQVYCRIQKRRPNDEVSIALEELERITDGKVASAKDYCDDEQSTALTETIYGLEDNDGNIWLGAEKAILRFDERARDWRIYPLPEKLIDAGIIYEDRKGRLWFADSYEHISVYDKNSNNWVSYRLTDYAPINTSLLNVPFSIEAVYQDKNGQMLFGTSRGLLTFNEKEDKWQFFTSQNSGLPDDSITTITEDNSGRIWIGTGQGIVILNR